MIMNIIDIPKAESDRINREKSDISKERQGYQSQRSQADAKRFRGSK